jgi:hypothetical protein
MGKEFGSVVLNAQESNGRTDHGSQPASRAPFLSLNVHFMGRWLLLGVGSVADRKINQKNIATSK